MSLVFQYAAVQIFIFPLGWYRVYEINRIHHWCSVGTEKPNLRAHHSSGKRGLPSFPLNGGPEGWNFFASILFLIYHDRMVQYCVISAGDVTEIDVYSQ